MIDLPQLGAQVQVWPMPGRRVLTGPYQEGAALLAQAATMPTSGQWVKWDFYWLSQLQEGAILMHAPPCDEHDHGTDGVDDCIRCGRSLGAAQVYDVHVAHGAEAAKADAAALELEQKAAIDSAAAARKDHIAKTKEMAASHVEKVRQHLARPPVVPPKKLPQPDKK